MFGGHYPPSHTEGNPYGYVGKDGRALDHTTHLAEHAFVKSLPKEFETLATLNHMFHVFFDLYDGPHELTNDTGGQFSWLKDFMKVISVAKRNAWLKSKIYMIRMIIVDEIVVRKRIGMRVFAFGKLACEYFPTYLEMAKKLAIEDASAEETAPTKMNVSIKIIFDPTTTLMKYEDTHDVGCGHPVIVVIAVRCHTI
jgi:hypothetical protein